MYDDDGVFWITLNIFTESLLLLLTKRFMNHAFFCNSLYGFAMMLIKVDIFCQSSNCNN